MALRQLTSAAVKGKKVLVCTSLDVPVNARGRVADAFRLERAQETLAWLVRKQASVIVIGHRGQPKGKPTKTLSLRPVASALGRLLRLPVHFVALRWPELAAQTEALRPGSIMVVENLRFHPGEEAADPRFAKKLADLAEYYVNDDFATCHRRHASVVLLPKLLPAFAGFSLTREVRMLSRLRRNVRRPYLAIIGGAKVHDKLSMLERLLRDVDAILLGGGAANTFLAHAGFRIGASLVDAAARGPRVNRLRRNNKVLLPYDVLVARSLRSTKARVADVASVPLHAAVFDLGPTTVKEYVRRVRNAKTIFWSGPLGATENPLFRHATEEVAHAIPQRNVFAIAGGGDTVRALHAVGAAGRFDFLSTGGSAMLDFIAGQRLPGITALTR